MDKELFNVLSSLLDEKLAPIKDDISGVKNEVGVMKDDISGIKNEVVSIKDDMSGMKNEIGIIKDDMSGMKNEIGVIKDDIKYIKAQQEESYLILKSLEHNSEVNKAEHDKFSNDVAHLYGEVESMRKDLSAVEVVTARNMEHIAQLKVIK